MSRLSRRGRAKSPYFHLQHRLCHDALADVNDVLKDSRKALQSIVSHHYNFNGICRSIKQMVYPLAFVITAFTAWAWPTIFSRNARTVTCVCGSIWVCTNPGVMMQPQTLNLWQVR